MKKLFGTEYGLRRYETSQRGLWLLFFVFCFLAAGPAGKAYRFARPDRMDASLTFQPEALQTAGFWTQQFWIHEAPLGSAIVYLAFVALFFLGGRFLWLVVQYGIRWLVEIRLKKATRNLDEASEMARLEAASEDSPSSPRLPGRKESRPPIEALHRSVSRIPFRFLFHPYQRLWLMLNSHQSTLSAEELVDKERRVSEMDWQLFWTTWQPLRWFLWLLPFMALIQAGWIFYQRAAPVLQGQREIMDAVNVLVVSLLPLAQVSLLSIAFYVAYGVSKQLEALYLSNIDALFYDRLLSRLPFQSSDTVILLKALKDHFLRMQGTLDRIERALHGGRFDSEG